MHLASLGAAVEAVDLSDMTEGEKRRDRVGEVKEYDYSR